MTIKGGVNSNTTTVELEPSSDKFHFDEIPLQDEAVRTSLLCHPPYSFVLR